MKQNEIAIFEAQVINSILDNSEKVRVLKLIDAQKNKIDVSSAMAEHSEGIGFD